MAEVDMQHLFGASAVTPERLELMGKYASKAWREGKFPDLSAAVIETTKEASLVPEQLRRVIEFANTDAFLDAFHKMGSQGHKYVDFGDGALADPSRIIGEINTKIASAPQTSDLSDYMVAPTETFNKHASAEEAFVNAFKSSMEPVELLNPDADFWDMHSKTAAVHANIVSELNMLDLHRDMIDYDLVYAVKEAASEGYPMGDILKVFAAVCEEPVLCKTAFELAAPALLNSGLIESHEKLAESLEKTSSAQLVDLSHPVAIAYANYCNHIVKSAAMRQEMKDVGLYFGHLEHMRKTAAPAGKPGMLARTFKLFENAAPHVGDWAKSHISNNAWKDVVGGGAELATQYAPVAALLGGGYMAHKSLSSSSPAYNAVTNAGSSLIQGGANAISSAAGVNPYGQQQYYPQ